MTPILFDLDRTLVDVQTYTDYGAALADVESLIGGWDDPPTPPTGWDGPTRRAMGVLVALTGDGRWQQVSDVIEAHERRAVKQSVMMPGVLEALTATANNPRAVVTLLPPGTARVVLRHHGLDAHLDLDLLVGRRADLAAKPAPHQLLEGCRLLGVEPAEAVMIGDSTWDAVAAEAVGCGFVGVTNGSASEFGARPSAATLEQVVGLLP